MTATVQFTTASATDVLTVPNAALRIKPTTEMLAEARAIRRTVQRRVGRDRKVRLRERKRRPPRGRRSPDVGRSGTWATTRRCIWRALRRGISDGQKTEVTSTRHQGRHAGRRCGGRRRIHAARAPRPRPTNPFQPARPPAAAGRAAGSADDRGPAMTRHTSHPDLEREEGLHDGREQSVRAPRCGSHGGRGRDDRRSWARRAPASRRS